MSALLEFLFVTAATALIGAALWIGYSMLDAPNPSIAPLFGLLLAAIAISVTAAVLLSRFIEKHR